MQSRTPAGCVGLAVLDSEIMACLPLVTSSFWEMRLSIAFAATDAEFQNRIILHDKTLNFPVVSQQPHPDPNYAPHAAARLLA